LCFFFSTHLSFLFSNSPINTIVGNCLKCRMGDPYEYSVHNHNNSTRRTFYEVWFPLSEHIHWKVCVFIVLRGHELMSYKSIRHGNNVSHFWSLDFWANLL
jgi:hypothetical protein